MRPSAVPGASHPRFCRYSPIIGRPGQVAGFDDNEKERNDTRSKTGCDAIARRIGCVQSSRISRIFLESPLRNLPSLHRSCKSLGAGSTRRAPPRGGHRSRTIPVPIHSFLRGSGRVGRGAGGEGTWRGDSRENYRLGCTAPRRERVIPFNRGIEFFPDAESSWHRVRTAPPVPVPPIPLPFSRPSLRVLSSAALNPHPSSPLSRLSLSSIPPPSPGIPGTALSQPWRRVARGNCASRRRRADVTPGMELTRAAPLYAVVEGNKKCKSKRVGVGEWEKKNKRRARVEGRGG